MATLAGNIERILMLRRYHEDRAKYLLPRYLRSFDVSFYVYFVILRFMLYFQ